MTAHLSKVLAAGGVVPVGAKLAKDDVVDTVVARAYRHPVLPGRAVVRLTADNVAAGDDLEMSVLGFGAGEDRGAVAKQRRRPLGFPGWALVHDANNARYALDVVGELKKQTRRAKSKPGHAKDGVEAIAVKLGKTVPQFLPSFYEEAGRAFIEHGAPTVAAILFGKAREAEAVHALEVDELHRVDAFLEFALAGAVTTKALTEYAKQLGDNHAPAEAYAHFRQLSVQRTLGGMPPWAGMAKDLRKLARAAKLDADAEDARLIEDIAASPALSRAAGEFWRAYQDAIVALAKRVPAVRGTLLNLFPTGGGVGAGAEIDAIWLELLDRSGAVEALLGDGAPDDAGPSGGRAAWFDKLLHHLARSWRNRNIGGHAYALLRRMAPALIEDDQPIKCVTRWNRLELDLAELALELGVAIEPDEHAQIDLSDWAEHAGEPEQGRDPVRCAAHPRLGELLANAVAEAIGEDEFDTASRGKLGFVAAKRRWLESLLDRAERAGLPGVADVLGDIDGKVKAETFAEFADLHARFAALDVAPALARTLQIGLYDELGWPALEGASVELNPDGKLELTFHGGLPAVVVANATRAIAVAHDRRLATHDLVIPAKHELASLRYMAGQFLVALKLGYKLKCYWSDAPHELFDADDRAWRVAQLSAKAAVLGDGAWVDAMRPTRPGDRQWPAPAIHACDGTTTWMRLRKDNRWVMQEVSATGEIGRVSWPAFVDAWTHDADWQLDVDACYVLPAPPGLTASPLGCKDGLLGVRARFQSRDASAPRRYQGPWTAQELERIDGKRYAATTAPSANHVDARFRELLELPSGELRPVLDQSQRYDAHGSTIADAAGSIAGSEISDTERRYWRGSPCPLPSGLWHALAGRDVAGSKRLRVATDADARALIDAQAGRTYEQLADDVPVAAVAARLPDVTHPRLQQGVAGVAALAAQLQIWRDRLRDERAPGNAIATGGASGPDDDAIKEALQDWIETGYGTGSAVSEIARAGAWFRSDDRGDRRQVVTGKTPVVWSQLALRPGVLVFLARAVCVGDDRRKMLEALHELLARELPDPTRLRTWTGERTPSPTDDGDDKRQLTLRWHGGNAYAYASQGWSATQFRVLEYAPDGVWKPLPSFAVASELRGTGAVAMPATGATAVADAERLAELTGMTRSEAVYLLAGCPYARSRDSSFLDKQLREQLDLKATQAQVARDSLKVVPADKRRAAIDDAARAGGSVDALVTAWIAHVGKRVTIPEELIADADRELRVSTKPSVALGWIGAADDCPQLTVDRHWGFDADGDVIAVASPTPLVGQTAVDDDDDAAGFDEPVLDAMCSYLPFVYAELPVGHELRAQAARAHALVLERLRAPGLMLSCGKFRIDDDSPGAEALLATLGGEPIAGFGEGHSGKLVPGAAITRYEWTYGSPPETAVRFGLVLRPGALDSRSADVIAKLAALVHDDAWPHVQLIRGDGFAAMMKRIADTPVPAGGWEQNPLASATKLVARVADKLELSREAATLYLQYLVLLWPTPKNLLMWNGWKPKQLDTAQAELVAHDLVLEAKRERAQRAHFLPGGWEALKSPHPPMETWKLALYGTRSADGHVSPDGVRSFLALAPFHVLFERAWKRVEAGDVPKYEEVKRK